MRALFALLLLLIVAPVDAARTFYMAVPANTCIASSPSGTGTRPCGYLTQSAGAQANGSISALDAAASQYSYIDGFHINTNWLQVEPCWNVYDWSYFDTVLAAIASLNATRTVPLQVSIDIKGGSLTPLWLFASQANSTYDQIGNSSGITCSSNLSSFAVPLGGPYPSGTATVDENKNQNSTWCSQIWMPLPWDTVFLTEWNRMIAAMGVHIAASPYASLVKEVKVTGINYAGTSELILPTGSGGASACNPGTSSCNSTFPACNAGGAGSCATCTYPNDLANWTTAGYTSAKLLTGFTSILTQYNTSFPTQRMNMQTGANGETPNLDAGGGNYAQTGLAPYGYATYGARFMEQVNDWTDNNLHPTMLNTSRTYPIGFQESTPASNCNDTTANCLASGTYWYDGPGTVGAKLVNGTYNSVSAGSCTGVCGGSGATYTVTVSGGIVSNLSANTAGSGYTKGDVYTIPTANIGGSGTAPTFGVSSTGGAPPVCRMNAFSYPCPSVFVMTQAWNIARASNAQLVELFSEITNPALQPMAIDAHAN